MTDVEQPEYNIINRLALTSSKPNQYPSKNVSYCEIQRNLLICRSQTHQRKTITLKVNYEDATDFKTNYLNIVIISFSNLLQQMLVLSLHVIICLSNTLQSNRSKIHSESETITKETDQSTKSLCIKEFHPIKIHYASKNFIPLRYLYFRQVVLILFVFRLQDIRQITHFPEIENNMDKQS